MTVENIYGNEQPYWAELAISSFAPLAQTFDNQRRIVLIGPDDDVFLAPRIIKIVFFQVGFHPNRVRCFRCA